MGSSHRAWAVGTKWGERVQHYSELDKTTIPCSGRIIIQCGCGEQMILLGLEEDWRSERRTDFECPCGKGLTISDRLNEDALAFRQIMRSTIKVHRARGYHH
jgi:hypothetical protein